MEERGTKYYKVLLSTEVFRIENLHVFLGEKRRVRRVLHRPFDSLFLSEVGPLLESDRG